MRPYVLDARAALSYAAAMHHGLCFTPLSPGSLGSLGDAGPDRPGL